MKRILVFGFLMLLIFSWQVCIGQEFSTRHQELNGNFVVTANIWKIDAENDYLFIQPIGLGVDLGTSFAPAESWGKCELLKVSVAKDAEIILLGNTDKLGIVDNDPKPITLEDLMVSDQAWISIDKYFSPKDISWRENIKHIKVLPRPGYLSTIENPLTLAPKELLPYLTENIISCDFSIMETAVSPKTGIVRGDLTQITALIRDYGFAEEYTVKFLLDTGAELGPVETRRTGGINNLAMVQWYIPEDMIGHKTIKVAIVLREKVTKDPNKGNNEVFIQVDILEGTREGFYVGIPAAGKKKIGCVIFQSTTFPTEDTEQLVSQTYNDSDALNVAYESHCLNMGGKLTFDFMLNPDSKNDLSLFYLQEFMRSESIEHTGKELIFPEIEIIGPFLQRLPLDANPALYFENCALERGVELKKYDIISYIYVVPVDEAVKNNVWPGMAYRDYRTFFTEVKVFKFTVSDFGGWQIGNATTNLEEYRRMFRQHNAIGVFIHEVMHMFGANDHYSGYASMGTPDIMTSNVLNINYITAEEIGWADRNHNGIIDAEEPYLYQFHGPSDILYPKWDADMNGVIDVSDLMFVCKYMGEEISPSHNNPNPDANRDGVVNILDLILVANHFGESSTAAAPSKDGWQVKAEDLPLLQQICRELENVPQKDTDTLRALELIRRLISSAEVPVTALGQNYPNPFNPETWIPFQLAEPAEVDIKIYSATGQLVRELNLGHKPAGFYSERNKAAYWDGRNDTGEKVSSGIYFYIIKAGDFTATKKLVISK